MSDEIKVPALLQIPDKLVPILNPDNFNQFRYFLLEGGRGGGKSQAIARLILYLADRYNLRIVCGRETQNSINESVYSIFTDLIKEFSLPFDIQASRIISRNKESVVNFRGFREQGRFNIQGMEGVDICWIDEAQAITKQTLDILIPTIRKEKARVFFSMNRYLVNDPVYDQFNGREDCKHIYITYKDNPFCTLALQKEAEQCLLRSEKDYNHIWLGMPADQSSDALFGVDELMKCKEHHYPLKEGYGARVAGFDIARYGEDKNACVIFQQMGALHWDECYVDEWSKVDLNYTTGRILQICNEQEVNLASIDIDGLGAGPFDTLVKGRNMDMFVGFKNPNISYQNDMNFVNPRTINAYKLKDMVSKTHIGIHNDELINELLSIKYTFDANQRRVLVSKEKMRKDGIKSPNLADAAIMAVSLIGQVKEDQDKMYESKEPEYARDESLFKIAGIR